MKIKFRKEHAQLNSRFFSDKIARKFMSENDSEHEAVAHNMNFYRLVGHDILVHVYDAYELKGEE